MYVSEKGDFAGSRGRRARRGCSYYQCRAGHTPGEKRLSRNRPLSGCSRIESDPDGILPEYDFKRSERNKFASRYAAGSAVIVLEPDVAVVFPNSAEASEALRALAGVIQKQRQRRVHSRRSL